MFELEKSLQVNADPNQVPVLSRSDVWQGLILKAEHPMPFVAAISDCRIVERFGDGFIREITLRSEILRERITFEPERRVIFERISGTVGGTIVNEIRDGDGDALALVFTFRLEAEGLASGSQEEAAFAETMKDSYLAAVASTLDHMRRLKAEEAAM